MNVYERFLRELFGGERTIRDADFCGRFLIGKIDDQIIVKIVLVSTERSQKIDAILCTILNRYGVIDKQMILFSELIPSAPKLLETDDDESVEKKFGDFNMERLRETVLGYIRVFYDKSHDRGEAWA